MNVLTIIIKEIKQNLRDKKAMAMMVAFPLLLIIVLGAAFKTSFSTSTSIGKALVFYKIENTGAMAEDFKKNFIDKGKEFNISFVKTDNIIEAKKKIVSNEYDAIIDMKNDNVIEIYKNDNSNLKLGIVETTLAIYVQQANLALDILKINPSAIDKVFSNTNTNYTVIKSVNKSSTPSSLDYYAVAEIALIIMYAGMTGLYGMASEKNYKTKDRILISPIPKYDFLLGKMLGGVIVTFIQIAIVVAFSKYVLKANWGTDITTILLILSSQIIMAISLGVGLGFLFKNENVAGGVLNFMIPILVFFGGSYMPVDGFGNKIFQLMSYISPVRWVNRSIFDVIYNNDYSKVPITIIINLTVAVAFLAASSLIFRKEGVK
ncbi:MAG TPA: ABC transporter permease [Clostridiaceae bacterium]